MSHSKVEVMSDDEETSDYDRKNITVQRLDDNFRIIRQHRHHTSHSPESTTEQVLGQLPEIKPKRTYRKKTDKDKEPVSENKQERRQRKRSEKIEKINNPNTVAVPLSSSLSEENNQTIRELLSKIHVYEEVLTELGHHPIQLWMNRRPKP
jgi:hypothetical protein